jgi:putative Holliday junction resolvase
MTSSEASSAGAAFPDQGRLLGLDYGTRRIGVAVSTPEQSIASALVIIERTNAAADADKLRKLATEHRIVGLIVGLPVLLSGAEGESARHAREFGEWAAAATGLPVKFWDETFSSALADDIIREAGMNKKQAKERRDMLAAQAFLQSYLDSVRMRRLDGDVTATDESV